MSTLPPFLIAGIARWMARPPFRALTRGIVKLMLGGSFLPGSDQARRYAAGAAVASSENPADPFVVRCELEPGGGNGPLAGHDVVIKDNIEVAGLPTGFGLSETQPTAIRDAEVVERIRRAGGRIVGKTVLTELAVGGLGIHPELGTPPNPVSPGFVPGGSSSGTAVAIAQGLARYGVGGDGLGSIRIPSAWCGLVGLKPTFGALPTRGYQSVGPSLDCVGPIAATVADCATLYSVMADRPISICDRRAARIGICRQLNHHQAAPPVTRAIDSMLRRLGAQQVVVDIPQAELAILIGACYGALELWQSSRRLDGRTPEVQFAGALGQAFDPALVRRLAEMRSALRESAHNSFRHCDLLAMPTTAIPAPPRQQAWLDGGVDTNMMLLVGRYTPLANCAGLPAIAVPCGRDEFDRALSIMFVGPPDSEELLFSAAALVESLSQPA